MKTGAAVGGLALLAWLAVGAVGCGSSSHGAGGPSGPRGDAGFEEASVCDGGCGTAVDASPRADVVAPGSGESCTACETTATGPAGACTSQATACLNDMSCAALFGCLNTCGNVTCMDNCRTMNGAGVAGYDALTNCLCGASTCEAACGDECSQTGPDAGASCETCAKTATAAGGACASEASACNESAPCAALLNCLDDCPVGDSSCQTNCNTENPGGSAGVAAVDMCLCSAPACASACASVCGG